MFKILLFRNTPYFKELSPYSLIMFASICEVKDYKYGEIVVTQDDKPDACYLVATGRC
jgi:CRP-like cAMP-binding protein